MNSPRAGMIQRITMTQTTRYTGHLEKRPVFFLGGAATVGRSVVVVIAAPPVPGTVGR